MAYCSNCGTDMGSTKFCPQCGTPAPQPKQTAPVAAQPFQQGGTQQGFQQQGFGQQQGGAQQGFQQQGYGQQQGGYQPPVMPAYQGGAQSDAQANKVISIFAYIIFLIPLLAAKESPFARYHTNQGLTLFLAAVAYGIVYSVLTGVLSAISWRLGLIVSSVLGLGYIGITVLSIIGIINVCNGEMKPLPLIGGITLLK